MNYSNETKWIALRVESVTKAQMGSHTGKVKDCQTLMTVQQKSFIGYFLFLLSPLMYRPCNVFCDLITAHIILYSLWRTAGDHISILSKSPF